MRSVAVILIAPLLAAIPPSAHAQSVLEIAAGIKFCKTLTDDTQRLKCFDGLFTQKQSQPAEQQQTEGAWSIEEGKSPADDSPQVVGSLDADDAALFLRCKENKTEAYFGKKSAFFGIGNSVKVLIRINDGKPIETAWQPSTNGQGIFAPAAVQFIRALPDNGKLFLRATGYGGTPAEGQFNLGSVSILRDKIAAACKWASATAPATPPSAPPAAKRPN
jgi:Type VI secretion system VasI, EvfG, VC_A0118